MVIEDERLHKDRGLVGPLREDVHEEGKELDVVSRAESVELAGDDLRHLLDFALVINFLGRHLEVKRLFQHVCFAIAQVLNENAARVFSPGKHLLPHTDLALLAFPLVHLSLYEERRGSEQGLRAEVFTFDREASSRRRTLQVLLHRQTPCYFSPRDHDPEADPDSYEYSERRKEIVRKK